MKRIVAYLIALLLIISAFLSPAATAISYIGTLPYWKSNSGSIGRWTLDYYTVGAIKLNASSVPFSGYFVNGVLNGCDEWDNALDTLTTVNTFFSSTATFNVYGGTESELCGTGYFSLFDFPNNNITGVTKFDSIASWGMFQYYVSGSYVDKTAVEHLGVTVGIVEKTYTEGYLNKIRNTCLHELGHAFGWHGHSSVSADVMHPNVSTTYTLTNNDRNHLRQVYKDLWY